MKTPCELEPQIKKALENNLLSPSSVENLLAYLAQPDLTPVEHASIAELVETQQFTELNNRFYKHLAFGTGGIRGRTIAHKVTQAELGNRATPNPPEHPATGTAVINTRNIRRAALGLGQYLKKAFPGIEPLKVVIAHDTRHFSPLLARTSAEALASLGIHAYLFSEDRSTPQLSFTVRHLQAHAGIVISASHNPPHDNGFKCYFSDGGQLVEPHASAVIAEVKALTTASPPPQTTNSKGQIKYLSSDADQAYLQALQEVILDHELLASSASKLLITYTALHGTGARIIPTLLKSQGFTLHTVAEQMRPDGEFPTVASPNPENAEALTMAIECAKNNGSSLVIATDPDCDRMGIAVRDRSGEFHTLTGNQIGSILAYYRTSTHFRLGLLNASNASRAVLIKTFVTTDLQAAIAQHFGLRLVNTLTGFKYIGEKLLEYEKAAQIPDYARQPLNIRRSALLSRSSYFVFGGEESYGYSGGDYVRDKDANAAALMIAEAALYAQSQNLTLLEYLDKIYLQFGYYIEKLGTLTFEGATGATTISRLLKSYRESPPQTMQGLGVTQIQDFERHDFFDADGKAIPKEMMLIYTLADGSRMAVRGSGTEPKIKFYFFTKAAVPSPESLPEVKKRCQTFLNSWWQQVQEDVKRRTAQ
ncbi:MAG: phospho-sugar mutase [Verrucomicrobiae bacterium]|nr:phospho-sugar mutase [Verrucomicrobiae bacterium]